MFEAHVRERLGPEATPIEVARGVLSWALLAMEDDGGHREARLAELHKARKVLQPVVAAAQRNRDHWATWPRDSWAEVADRWSAIAGDLERGLAALEGFERAIRRNAPFDPSTERRGPKYLGVTLRMDVLNYLGVHAGLSQMERAKVFNNLLEGLEGSDPWLGGRSLIADLKIPARSLVSASHKAWQSMSHPAS